MSGKTIDEILGDFNESGSHAKTGLKERACVTIWIPMDYKARYDRLQKRSGRQLSKKAREALLELIEVAETRAG